MDEDLLLFIKSSIRSVWALEILLFMRRHRGRTWTREELAQELRSNTRLVAQVLAVFESAGLLIGHENGLMYAPASEALDELSGRLQLAYQERPVAVVNAIVSSRADPLQTFADAFRLKGDPKT